MSSSEKIQELELIIDRLTNQVGELKKEVESANQSRADELKDINERLKSYENLNQVRYEHTKHHIEHIKSTSLMRWPDVLIFPLIALGVLNLFI